MKLLTAATVVLALAGGSVATAAPAVADDFPEWDTPPPLVQEFGTSRSEFYPTVRDGWKDDVGFDVATAYVEEQSDGGDVYQNAETYRVDVRNRNGALVATRTFRARDHDSGSWYGEWTWGGKDVFGMFNLGDLGFSDFAGSGIVHMAGAAAALAGVLLLGPRKGKYGPDGEIRPIPGANLPLATLGTFILWMGWFGFNGGSVLKLGDIANANSVAMVFLNTNAAAAGGLVAALVIARMMFGKADLTMALNGALAGLVAITAEPSTPSALQATIFGAMGGALVVFSILTLDKLKIDDPVGAISVHGVVGLLGLLLVPLTNDGSSFSGQLIGAATIFIWVFGASLIVWLVIKLIMGIRVSEEEEYEGVELRECGMEAYPEFTGTQGSGL